MENSGTALKGTRLAAQWLSQAFRLAAMSRLLAMRSFIPFMVTQAPRLALGASTLVSPAS